ncbi:MAG: phosphotransferase [bacterium]|nr:phosphotransferase [bacterium]
MSAALPHDALARVVERAFGADAHCERADALHGDASTRRYLRLHLRGAPAPTAIAMVLGEGRFTPGSDEIVGGGPAVTELPYVNVGRWLAAHDFPIPRLWHDAAADEGLLLVEDVGDTTLFAATCGDPARTEPLFAGAVDLLVALQVAGARAPDPACYAFHRRFDAALARAELEHFVDHGVETRHGRVLPAAERRALLRALEPVVAPFEDAATVLSHRDYMAWNVHIQDGRLRLIDFQDALCAPDAFDLAQLLTDRTTPERIDVALEQRLIARFVAARAAAGWPVPSGFEERYRLCALQHAFKVIGRFWYLERVKGKPGYFAYLPAVYGLARRLLAATPALAPIRPRLAALVPELAPS